MPTEYNSPIWRGHRPRADAGAVAWARAAGAVVLGKTVTTEFATRSPARPRTRTTRAHAGRVQQRVRRRRRRRLLPLRLRHADRRQRHPPGRVLRRGGLQAELRPDRAAWHEADGVLARHGRRHGAQRGRLRAAGRRRVGARAWAIRSQAAARSWRIGLCRSPAWAGADEATQALLHDAAERLRRAGAVVDDRELPAPYPPPPTPTRWSCRQKAPGPWGGRCVAARDELSAGLRERLEWGLSHAPDAVDAARAILDGARRGFAAATEAVDVLLTPSAPGEAPAGLEWTGDPSFNSLWTGLHVPCVTVPAGTGPARAAAGLQVVGRLAEDEAVLAAAHWVGEALSRH